MPNLRVAPVTALQPFLPEKIRPQPVPRMRIQRLSVPGAMGLARILLAEGLVAPDALREAEAEARLNARALSTVLRARNLLSEDVLMDAQARHWRLRAIDPRSAPPDPRLVDAPGAAACLMQGLLPWRRVAGHVVVLTDAPETAARSAARLRAAFGPYVLAVATPTAIDETMRAARGAQMAHRAETRLAEGLSCRPFGQRTMAPAATAFLAACALLLWVAPIALGAAITLLALAGMLAVSLLKIAALTATLLPDRRCPATPRVPGPLPFVSLLVALYREGAVAERLVRHLERLDYPRDRMEVLVAVEADDSLTRRALERAALPPWMRTVVVPDGTIRTKPRALNLALDQCRGDVIGVYDAEDAPAPDQLRLVAAAFAQAPARVACLQGVLDFYNPRSNWLARCFTLEYATWFRVLLPGLARLGLPLPLGGTTLFFRRRALENLGGWDAHNVTEDADLGMRLHRAGYRTALLDSVTMEEANCRTLPWIRQRSRWLKGYMATWAVHMRAPRQLWRDLGPAGFLGFQILFLGTLLQFLLAPVLWSLWLVPLGVHHPLLTVASAPLLEAIFWLFIATEIGNLALGCVGLWRRGGGVSPLWLPTLHLYFPLGALASYKAAAELLRRPFHWDKTSHGHFAPQPAPVGGRLGPMQRIALKRGDIPG